MTRVLYSFPTRLGTPGIGTTAYEQVAGLARDGHDVTVVCGSLERPLPDGVAVRETMRVAGVRVPYRLVGKDRALAHHDRRVARLLAAAPGRHDVVHAWPLGAEATLAAAREHGVASVLERPNAHTAFAFAAVAGVLDELGLEPEPGSPHTPDRDPSRARGARVRAGRRPAAARRTSSRARSGSAASPRPACCATATAATRRASPAHPRGRVTGARADGSRR